MPPTFSTVPSLPALAVALGSALAILALAITGLRRAARGVELARLPLAAQADVRLDAAGPVVLAGEGPRLTTRFGGLAFRLVDRTSGVRVPERRVWLRTSVSGWSRVRQALVRFDVERPGVYRLEVAGLAAATDDGIHALVLVPAPGVALPAALAATIAAAGVAVASTVGIGWHVLESAGTSSPVISEAPPSFARDAVRPPGASGGRQLAPPADLGPDAVAVHWTKGALTLRVPPAFVVRASGDELDVRDPASASTYVVGHVVAFPPPTTAALLVSVAAESAAGRLTAGLIEGFATVRFGGVDGVLTIESRGEGSARMVVWNGYQPTPDGVRNVTLLFGAESAAFARAEAAAHAVFASLRFD